MGWVVFHTLKIKHTQASSEASLIRSYSHLIAQVHMGHVFSAVLLRPTCCGESSIFIAVLMQFGKRFNYLMYEISTEIGIPTCCVVNSVLCLLVLRLTCTCWGVRCVCADALCISAVYFCPVCTIPKVIVAGKDSHLMWGEEYPLPHCSDGCNCLLE